MRKAASPETPLMHYKATQQVHLVLAFAEFKPSVHWQATSSINHRIFYVNVVARLELRSPQAKSTKQCLKVAMVLVYDLGSSMLDF